MSTLIFLILNMCLSDKSLDRGCWQYGSTKGHNKNDKDDNPNNDELLPKERKQECKSPGPWSGLWVVRVFFMNGDKSDRQAKSILLSSE